MLHHIGVNDNLLGPATRLVCQPLWFIAVYVLVTALAPAMHDLHRRSGARAIAALALGAALVDFIRFGLGLNGIGYLNLAFVWLFAQQLGFAYADGSLTRVRRRRLLGTAIASFAALFALTHGAGYPTSMVGLPGARVSNPARWRTCAAAHCPSRSSGIGALSAMRFSR